MNEAEFNKMLGEAVVRAMKEDNAARHPELVELGETMVAKTKEFTDTMTPLFADVAARKGAREFAEGAIDAMAMNIVWKIKRDLRKMLNVDGTPKEAISGDE